jgi:hypothetical protein
VCTIGPAVRYFANEKWFAYACSDDTTMVLMAAPGNSMSPAIFTFSLKGVRYHITGAGQANRSAAQAAFQEIRTISTQGVKNLIEEAKYINQKNESMAQ